MRPVDRDSVSDLGVVPQKAEPKWYNKHVRVLSLIPGASIYIAYKAFQQQKGAAAAGSLVPYHSTKYLDKYSKTEACFLAVPVLGNIFAFFKVLHEKASEFRQDTAQTLLAQLKADNPQYAIDKFKHLSPEELGGVFRALHDEARFEVLNRNAQEFMGMFIHAQDSLATKAAYVKELIPEIRQFADRPETLGEWISNLVQWSGCPQREIENAILEAGWKNVSTIPVNTRWEFCKQQKTDVMYALNYLGLEGFDPGLHAGFDQKCKGILSSPALVQEMHDNEAEFFSALQKAVKGYKYDFTDFFNTHGQAVVDAFLDSCDRNEVPLHLNRMEFACTLLQKCNLSTEYRRHLLDQIAQDFDQLGMMQKPSAATADEVRVMANVLKEFNKFNREDLSQKLSLRAKVKQKLQRAPQKQEVPSIQAFYENARDFVQYNPHGLPDDDKPQTLLMFARIHNKLFAPEKPSLQVSKVPSSLRIHSKNVEAKLAELTNDNNKSIFLTDANAFYKWIQDNKAFISDPQIQTAIKEMINELPRDMRQPFLGDIKAIARQQKTPEIVAFFFEPILREIDTAHARVAPEAVIPESPEEEEVPEEARDVVESPAISLASFLSDELPAKKPAAEVYRSILTCPLSELPDMLKPIMLDVRTQRNAIARLINTSDEEIARLQQEIEQVNESLRFVARATANPETAELLGADIQSFERQQLDNLQTKLSAARTLLEKRKIQYKQQDAHLKDLFKLVKFAQATDKKDQPTSLQSFIVEPVKRQRESKETSRARGEIKEALARIKGSLEQAAQVEEPEQVAAPEHFADITEIESALSKIKTLVDRSAQKQELLNAMQELENILQLNQEKEKVINYEDLMNKCYRLLASPRSLYENSSYPLLKQMIEDLANYAREEPTPRVKAALESAAKRTTTP